MDALAAAIEGLYQAFADVPRPTHIDPCPCGHCVNAEEAAALLQTPPRDITRNDLTEYASSAFLTVGGKADYLYFLPRILEINATDTDWWPHPEVTGRAVRSAEPATWTAGQRAALDGYLAAVVGAAVRATDGSAIDGWVCAAARMGRDVRPLLARVAENPAAVLAYFDWNSDDLPRGQLSNAFWEPPDPGHDAVVAWFRSPEVAAICSELTSPS